jgi:hypothetical protein
MKLRSVYPLLAFSLAGLCSSLLAADAASTAAGYWSGSISLPNNQKLAIAVELAPAADAAWQGTIDIPMQGVRGLKLSAVKVEGDAVEFAMPGIPGDPRFSGKLAAGAGTISGDFFQGEGTLPFHLERKAKPAPRRLEPAVPAKGVPGTGLAGKWIGGLSPAPAVELRLQLELTADSAGKVNGVVVSLDQGSPRIPISDLTEVNGKVNFATPSVPGDARFEGQMSSDGSEIAGTWSQGGRVTPLVFKRLPTTATP